MKQKVFSILAILLMAVTSATAQLYAPPGPGGIGGMTVTLSPSSLDMSVGEKASVTCNIGGMGTAIPSWSITSGEECISFVPLNAGNTTITIQADAAGTATIQCTAGSATATCNVKVNSVAVTSITLSQASASMTVGGETLTLTPTVAPSNATNKTVTWTTSDPTVATVADGTVTAVAAGTATITATATNGTADTSDDQTATCAVTVSNPTVTANSDGAATPSYWSTYYNATKSFTADENTTVYKAALNGTSSVTLTEVTGREIPADQAVILKSTTGTITLTPVATTTADMSGNVLKGGTTVTSGYDAYTLSRGSAGTGAVGFYKYSGATLDGSKAHLEIPTSAAPALSFIGFGYDNTTAIELPALAEDEAAEWYSLDGRRLSGKPARKGIYVRNGQKYIIR